MSNLDETYYRFPIDTHQPALLAPEATMLRRLHNDAEDLVRRFEGIQSADDWIDFWARWRRHCLAWRSTEQSTWNRAVKKGAVGLLDPDISTERAVKILVSLEDPHAALFTGGIWWAASQACQWYSGLSLESADDLESALASYLHMINARELGIQHQLTGLAQLAVLEMTGDLQSAGRASFESAEWVGAACDGAAFVLTVRREDHACANDVMHVHAGHHALIDGSDVG